MRRTVLFPVLITVAHCSHLYCSAPPISPMVGNNPERFILFRKVRNGDEKRDYSLPECEVSYWFITGFENCRSPPVSILRTETPVQDDAGMKREEDSAHR